MEGGSLRSRVNDPKALLSVSERIQMVTSVALLYHQFVCSRGFCVSGDGYRPGSFIFARYERRSFGFEKRELNNTSRDLREMRIFMLHFIG